MGESLWHPYKLAEVQVGIGKLKPQLFYFDFFVGNSTNLRFVSLTLSQVNNSVGRAKDTS